MWFYVHTKMHKQDHEERKYKVVMKPIITYKKFGEQLW